MARSLTQSDTGALQTRRFLLLYALASAGASASYAPFLTLLLPLRAREVWDVQSLEVLSYAAFVGAVSASLANIGFGWLSDRTRNRRGWIVAGLVLSGILLCMMNRVTTVPMLLVLIAAWQAALNMMLGPLMAMGGDYVPDAQKGTLGGLLSVAPATGALVGALITLPGLADADTRLVLNALLVAAMILPLVVFGRPRPMPQLMEPATVEAGGVLVVDTDPADKGYPVARMWVARLLVQIPEATLFAFLFLWFSSLDPAFTENDTARIFTIVLFASVPVSLVVGRWSDRAGRPRLPLTVATALSAIGILILAVAPGVAGGIAGYVLFGLTAGVFLSLHAGQTLRVLPRPSRRGRDLGIFNLTNTVPSLVMPWIVLALIPAFGFRGLFVLLAVLLALSSLILASIRRF
ncbi:MFS transporter [Qipengyuania sp. JC766]|uniref:MFS transporter n=1 Tax=Qipengyuania sp. JC766 TaxID=3232139 RepID=UPI00345A7CC9